MPQNPSETPQSANGQSGKGAAGRNAAQQKNEISQNGGPKGSAGAAPEADPLAMIRADHRKVEQLFGAFEKAGKSEEKSQLARQICNELMVHTLLEEEIFYPACRGHMEQQLLDEAQVEHDGAKALIREIYVGSPADQFFSAKVKVLAEEIRHHIREEEKAEGILAKAKEVGIATPQLASRLTACKQELMRDAEAGSLGPPEARSFRARINTGRLAASRSKENEMPRHSSATMERDERGRFMSDDDDRDYGRSRGRGRYDDDDRRMPARDEEGRFTSSRSRSRYDDDDDDRRGGRGHGGWYGDPRGHSEASREGWEHRGGMRSRSRYDDDDDDYRRGGRGHGGWFGDPEGHSRAAREGWDDPRHGPSGWYGDPRGHAEAARRGWDNPDHGPSGWYGDPRGHSEASRRGWDNPRHGRSGWYGDPEGHSEASREGWEHRGGMRSRSRYDDDDDDDRRGRGHGGWYGDPEGHSQAARRRR